MLVVQPPPRAGERQLGVFIDARGDVAPRSTIHWRLSPLGCMVRGRALITLLPQSVEIDHPAHDPPHQSLPFADAVCCADGGELLLLANTEAVWAVLPPAVSYAASRQRSRHPVGPDATTAGNGE